MLQKELLHDFRILTVQLGTIYCCNLLIVCNIVHTLDGEVVDCSSSATTCYTRSTITETHEHMWLLYLWRLDIIIVSSSRLVVYVLTKKKKAGLSSCSWCSTRCCRRRAIWPGPRFTDGSTAACNYKSVFSFSPPIWPPTSNGIGPSTNILVRYSCWFCVERKIGPT